MKTKKIPYQASRAIFEERVSKLIPLVSFMSRRQLLQFARKTQGWDVSVKQVDNYIKRARDYVLKNLMARRETAIQDIINNYNTLYMKALHSDDNNTCVRVLEKLTYLLGVDKMMQENIDLDNQQDVVID